MHIAVLAASGATGHQLAVQALARGHTVTAIARQPDALDLLTSDRLIRIQGDVRDASSVVRALRGADAVVSGLGATSGEAPGVLIAGASALTQSPDVRIIWLGAFGTGRSAEIAGGLTRAILKLALRSELPDKIAADERVLVAGGTVFHAGPLKNGGISPGYRTVQLEDVRRRWVPSSISRATVAAAMLDEAEGPRRAGGLLVPLP